SDDLEFVRLGAVKLPFSSDCFDVIVSFGTVAHLKEYEDFLSECKRVLKDQGLFICSTPNKEISSPKTERPLDCWHDKEFYVGEFHDLLNKYFTDIVLYGQRCLSDKQKTIDYIMANLGRKISTLPKGEQLKSLIARFVLRQNRRIRLRAEVALEKVSDKRYEPVPLHDNPLTPSIIIALATADKAR
ncbi:MAG: class I SAM-dependent methyltransferase, partial [Dehalococcoidia bacterium]